MKAHEKRTQEMKLSGYLKSGSKWEYRTKLISICDQEDCMGQIDLYRDMKNVGHGLWEAVCPDCQQQYIIKQG